MPQDSGGLYSTDHGDYDIIQQINSISLAASVFIYNGTQATILQNLLRGQVSFDDASITPFVSVICRNAITFDKILHVIFARLFYIEHHNLSI